MRRWSELAEHLAATTRTSEKTALLADYLRGLAPDELPIAAVFLTGRPFAEADQRAAGLGWSAIATTVTDLGIFVRCSKGTYLRTLAFDLGELLGPGAHLRSLRRLKVGPFGLAESVTLDLLMDLSKAGKRDELLARVLPIGRALDDLAELRLDDSLSRRVSHGHAPGPSDLSRLRAPPFPRGRKVRLVSPSGDVLAVAESDGVGTLTLLRVLVGGFASDSAEE